MEISRRESIQGARTWSGDSTANPAVGFIDGFGAAEELFEGMQREIGTVRIDNNG